MKKILFFVFYLTGAIGTWILWMKDVMGDASEAERGILGFMVFILCLGLWPIFLFVLLGVSFFTWISTFI